MTLLADHPHVVDDVSRRRLISGGAALALHWCRPASSTPTSCTSPRSARTPRAQALGLRFPTPLSIPYLLAALEAPIAAALGG